MKQTNLTASTFFLGRATHHIIKKHNGTKLVAIALLRTIHCCALSPHVVAD